MDYLIGGVLCSVLVTDAEDLKKIEAILSELPHLELVIVTEWAQLEKCTTLHFHIFSLPPFLHSPTHSLTHSQ
jgi:hypothetical protein